MSGPSGILDLSDTAALTEKRINSFLQSNNIHPLVTFDDTIKLAYYLVDKIVSKKMIWCRRVADYIFEHRLRELMPWYDDIRCVNELLIPFEEILTATADELEESIELLIPEAATYDIINMRLMGTNCVISRGEDYRIVDWERRMKSGEWSRDD